MINLIETRKRMVQNRIAKSFESGINVNDEVEIEKAHKDGDIHPNHPNWVWVSSAAGGKGDWRIANGRTHKKAGASSENSRKVDISKIPDAEFKRITNILEKKNPESSDAARHLEEEAMTDDELRNFYACSEHFKNSSSINKLTQNNCKKWAELARQELQYRKKNNGGNSTNPSPRKPGSTSEIERMTAQTVRSSILGLNNIGTNVKDKGDYFHIEFDANDFTTHGQRSPQIDRIAKFLEGMGASCIIGKNSIKAYKKVEAKKADPRDKIAQDAGFKDYSEMRGWQEYVTSKSLLKKPSTKGDSRKELETAVAKYEMEHADVIKRRKGNK